MRALPLIVALMMGAVGAAAAQLAVTQPTEKLLVLPMAASPADSAVSIVVADAVRDRLGQLAKYRMMVVPKNLLCQALGQSGFPCDGMLDGQQSAQLARHLQVDAYTMGTLQRNGPALSARVRVLDVGGSGLAASFIADNGNPGSPQALAETIAQRINTLIRASEHTRDCTTARQRGQFSRALNSAQKALAIDPTSTGAHLCVATVYEAQRMPGDSIIAASRRALAGDSLNSTALENIARAYQHKGDTLSAIDAFVQQLRGEPRNTPKRLAIVSLLRQMKQYPRAIQLLDDGLAVIPGDEQMIDLKTRICIEGNQYSCAVSGLKAQVARDSSVLRDSTWLKGAIGVAQQVPDPEALRDWSTAAVRAFPSNPSYHKVLGSAFELLKQVDSAVAQYKQAAALDPRDTPGMLLVAKTIIDHAVFDTAAANALLRSKDTASVVAMRRVFSDRLDTALTYLTRVVATPDTVIRLNAYVVMLGGGEKLAGAQVQDRAYVWLDEVLRGLAQRSPGDTVGPRAAIRTRATFYFLVPALTKLAADYGAAAKAKSCPMAKDVYDQHVRLKGAMNVARRASADFVRQLQRHVDQFDKAIPSLKASFKCRNF